MAPTSSTDGSQYREALARYRETARWVLTGLGAAAVASIAGFGLADFGKLSPDKQPLHFGVGCVGLALAVGGFLGSIYQALRLGSESWTEPTELAADGGDPDLVVVRTMVNDRANGLLVGFDSFGALSDAHQHALVRWRQEEERWLLQADRGSLELAERWGRRATFLASAVQMATLVASTRRLREKFASASRILLASASIAAVGIILFAWAVTGTKVT